MGTGTTAAVIVLQINFLFCITFRTVKVLPYGTWTDVRNSFYRPANFSFRPEMIVRFITQLVMLWMGLVVKPKVLTKTIEERQYRFEEILQKYRYNR